MKTKIQKKEELKQGKELLEKSQFLILADFTKVTAESLRRLRQETRKAGAQFLVIKKRLLNILLKEKGIDFDRSKFKLSLGTVFSPEIEKSASAVYKLFKELGVEKEKLLGGYDVKNKKFIEQKEMIMIGQLPPREVLLGQLVGMIAAPIRAFLYVLSEKAKKSGASAQGATPAVGQGSASG